MKLLAHTGDIDNESGYLEQEQTDEYPLGNAPNKHGLDNLFKNAYWTVDGSSVVTVNEDNAIRLFIVPRNLLDDGVKLLNPYSRRFMPSPILSSLCYPSFSLQDPATCGLFVSHRNAPVKLYNALTSSTQSEASYNLFNWSAESYVPAYSMAFTEDNALICGTDKFCALFDLNMADPIITLNGRGACSAVDSNMKRIAVGTFQGDCRIFDEVSGELIHERRYVESKSAVMQLLLTENYLFQINRRSNVIEVLDCRMDLRSIHKLHGYNGDTNQRIRVEAGFDGELYAGGVDGNVVCWKDALLGIDSLPQIVLKGSNSTVSSVSINPLNMGILATCSGHRHDEEESIDCSLKIWKM